MRVAVSRGRPPATGATAVTPSTAMPSWVLSAIWRLMTTAGAPRRRRRCPCRGRTAAEPCPTRRPEQRTAGASPHNNYPPSGSRNRFVPQHRVIDC